MPKYNFSTDGEDSDYESDNTLYVPVNAAKYKLSAFNPLKPISNRSIQIQLTLNGLNYFLRYKEETQCGHIPFEMLTSELVSFRNSLDNSNWLKILNEYTSKIIEIVLKNGHGRKGYLAIGSYSLVRMFVEKGVQQSEINKNKTKVVLEPIKCDYKESRKKYHFFNSLYPKEKSFYMEIPEKNTYRLVLPHITGTLFGDMPAFTELKEQINLFLATVKALKDCHSKEIICLDLNPYNIKYLSPINENESGFSYLIDGGFSQRVGETIDTEFFRCQNMEKLHTRMLTFDYIAPECWYIEKAPFAQEAMDIYSMGKILMKLLNPLSPELIPSIEACCKKEPTERATLIELENFLEDLLLRVSEINHFSRKSLC